MMRAISMLVLSAALGAGAVGAAVTLKPPASSSESGDHEGRPGPDSGRVAILLDAIGKTDPVVCEMIADQIGNFWNSGEDFGVGGFAATSLSLKAAKDSIGGHITDPRAINLLVSELGAPNPCVRRIASKMLGNSAVAAGRLRTLLGDGSPIVREAAAHAAGVGEKRDVLGALETSLGDRDATVGAMAAWAIGEIEDKSSIPALVRSMKGSERRVRLAAIWALGQISPKQAPKQLVAMLSDKDERVREMTAWALYEIEDPSTAPALQAALKAETNQDMQLKYIRALAAMGESSVDAIRPLLESSDPRVKEMAVHALAGGRASGPWPHPWPQPRPFP